MLLFIASCAPWHACVELGSAGQARWLHNCSHNRLNRHSPNCKACPDSLCKALIHSPFTHLLPTTPCRAAERKAALEAAAKALAAKQAAAEKAAVQVAPKAAPKPAAAAAPKAAAEPAPAAGTLDNVAEARQWIANWKAKQQGAPAAKPAAAPAPAAKPAAAPAPAAKAAAPAPAAAAAPAAASGTPDNVAEARQWIANWKASQGSKPAQQAQQGGDVPDNVAEARAWIGAWKAKQK